MAFGSTSETSAPTEKDTSLKKSKVRDKKGHPAEWTPIIKEFMGPLTFNIAMCQVELGFYNKALSMCVNLMNSWVKQDHPDMWNCLYKMGIIYDRKGDYDRSM